MLDLPSALLAHLNARGARRARLLVWIMARDRTLGTPASIGFWTGADIRTFSIGGEARIYHGAGSLLKISPLVMETGVRVRTIRLVMSAIGPEFRQAVRAYDLRDARVDIHIANFDPLTRALIADPQRRFKGYVKGLTFPRAELGGESEAELAVQSAARALTRTLPLRKSDEALRERHPGDGFRRYVDVSGSVTVDWIGVTK